MSEQRIWRLVAGHKRGPYTAAKLRPLVKDGRISPLDRFSYDGVSWAPTSEFPELLREPPPPQATPAEATFSVATEDDESTDDFVPPSRHEHTAVGDDESTQRLMKVVYWVVGVGSGLIALLVMLTVLGAVRRPAATTGQTAVDPAATARSPSTDDTRADSNEHTSRATGAGQSPPPDAGDDIDDAAPKAEEPSPPPTGSGVGETVE